MSFVRILSGRERGVWKMAIWMENREGLRLRDVFGWILVGVRLCKIL